MKGVIEGLAAALHLPSPRFTPATHTSFHPGKCAEVAFGRSEEHTSELQSQLHLLFPLFFLNDTATTEISPLSLHDALPICSTCRRRASHPQRTHPFIRGSVPRSPLGDRKSTRLNSSHSYISYSLFFF